MCAQDSLWCCSLSCYCGDCVASCMLYRCGGLVTNAGGCPPSSSQTVRGVHRQFFIGSLPYFIIELFCALGSGSPGTNGKQMRYSFPTPFNLMCFVIILAISHILEDAFVANPLQTILSTKIDSNCWGPKYCF